jgi:DNA-binding response OmpR family regulator
MASKKKVLLVDDDVDGAEAFERILALAGYEVTVVHNGAAALDWLASERPDLVILDVYMPVVSGLDVCRRMRERHETRLIPVMFLTAAAGARDVAAGHSAGSDLYLTKPVIAKKLLSMVGLFASGDVPLRAKSSAAGGR